MNSPKKDPGGIEFSTFYPIILPKTKGLFHHNLIILLLLILFRNIFIQKIIRKENVSKNLFNTHIVHKVNHIALK